MINQFEDRPERQSVFYGTRVDGTVTVSGIVHVIRTVEELPYFREGEILVAATIDPAWTAQLTLAKSLIESNEAKNSKARAIAQQYDLPTAVDVDNAMKLRSGDIVTIRGDGTIERVEEQRAPDSPMRVSVPAAVAARNYNGIVTAPEVVPFSKATSATESDTDSHESMDSGESK